VRFVVEKAELDTTLFHDTREELIASITAKSDVRIVSSGLTRTSRTATRQRKLSSGDASFSRK
jgi:hypothetical protein